MHPIIFMKSNLNSYMGDKDKFKRYLSYCFKNGIKMFPPSVNDSEAKFTVVGNEEGIRYGLKGLSSINSLSNLILEERNTRGLFQSFQDFVERMTVHHKLTKAQIINLVFAGALDEFEGTKRAKLMMIPLLQQSGKKVKQESVSGQFSMFDLARDQGLDDILELETVKTPDVEEFDKAYLLEEEKKSTGVYITAHPMDDFEEFIKEEHIIPLMKLESSSESMVESMEDDEDEELLVEDEISYVGQVIKVAGIVTSVKTIVTKNNEIMYKCTIEDRTGALDIVCFPKQVELNVQSFIEGKKIIVNGKFEINNFGSQVVVKSTVDLEDVISNSKTLYVKSSSDLEVARRQWKELEAILLVNANLGDTKIIFEQSKKDAKSKKFIFPRQINLSMTNFCKIQSIFGNENYHLNLD